MMGLPPFALFIYLPGTKVDVLCCLSSEGGPAKDALVAFANKQALGQSNRARPSCAGLKCSNFKTLSSRATQYAPASGGTSLTGPRQKLLHVALYTGKLVAYHMSGHACGYLAFDLWGMLITCMAYRAQARAIGP